MSGLGDIVGDIVLVIYWLLGICAALIVALLCLIVWLVLR